MKLFPRFQLEPPPRIASLADVAGRPSWSVMIPTYNSNGLFEQALRSVLDQDPGPDRMQIAVVDDGSTDRRHEEVVRRLAPQRVELYQRASNLGLARNWNECIARSRGRWVHILHQDDLVRPGFYERLARAGAEPRVGAAFCRHIYIDGQSRHDRLSIRHQPTAGILPNWLDLISRDQQIQCASIVVRRDVYESIGGFSTDLCYALDWEMWVRIAATYPVWFEPEPLACYRLHPDKETGRLRHADRDIADVHKAVKMIRTIVPAENRDAVGSLLLTYFGQDELAFTQGAFHQGELRSGLASFRRALKWDRSLRFSRVRFLYSKWALKISLGILLNRAAVRTPIRPSSDSNPDGPRTEPAAPK